MCIGTRSVWAEGRDRFGQSTVSGRFVLDSLTHGHVAFTKSYAGWSASYAGGLEAAQQSLVAKGRWFGEYGKWWDAGPLSPAAAVFTWMVDGKAAAEGQVGVELAPASDEHRCLAKAEPQPPELFVSAHSIDPAAAPAELELEQ